MTIKHINTKPSGKMKAAIYLTALCILSLSIFLGYSKFERNSDDVSIAVSDTDDSYQLVASYNTNLTHKVQRYINSSIKPNGLFSSESDYMDINTTLSDKTYFYIKESPGRLKVKIDKRRNSIASYFRIRKMCEGIKDVLANK